MALTHDPETMPWWGDRLGGVFMSKRYANYIRGWMRAMGEGLDGREALIAGADYGGMGGMVELRDEIKVRRMAKLLMQPTSQEAVLAVFREQGFDLSEALDWAIKHIRGEIVEQKVVVVKDADGNQSTEVVDVKIPPSYPALKDFLKATLPQDAKRVDIRSVHATVRAPREDGSPPKMAARPIGEMKGE